MDQIKIGRFIAEIRKQQKLTQREFADMLGISDKTVSKWECGNGMPELSFMQPLCKILKIDLNELESEKRKQNIVGGKFLGRASKVKMHVGEVHKTNTEFLSTIGSEFLEIGCGNGHSLKYAADLGAADLWGLDISAEQIERAKHSLDAQGIRAKLVCSPMEESCGLPTEYFDLIYSVYGIGWTTNLNQTFKHIHPYLKKDGILADNGFVIERLVEETDREKAISSDSDFGRKALMLPTFFVIRARKR